MPASFKDIINEITLQPDRYVILSQAYHIRWRDVVSLKLSARRHMTSNTSNAVQVLQTHVPVYSWADTLSARSSVAELTELLGSLPDM